MKSAGFGKPKQKRDVRNREPSFAYVRNREFLPKIVKHIPKAGPRQLQLSLQLALALVQSSSHRIDGWDLAAQAMGHLFPHPFRDGSSVGGKPALHLRVQALDHLGIRQQNWPQEDLRRNHELVRRRGKMGQPAKDAHILASLARPGIEGTNLQNRNSPTG